jgi:anti-sigma B factor antagonist
MVPIRPYTRLSISMQPRDTNWQTWNGEAPGVLAALAVQHKESELKLSLETRNLGDVMVIHCQGRIVYRDEAASLSKVVDSLLYHTDKLLLDLSGVKSLDSAGIGELVLVFTRAQEKNASLKFAGANSLVRTLLDLTNLDRVLDVHPSIESALEAFREQEVCADC